MRRYATVWRLPGARILLVGGVLSRLGIGVTPLALLLLVADATGRYTPAAIAGGVYAVANAALAPLIGRLADRVGPSPVLTVSAVAHPLALVALVVMAHRLPHGGQPTGVWAAAAVAGATFPPMSAAVRGAWNRLTAHDEALHANAFALETSLFEVVFVIGPLLVAGFVAFADATVAILASAVTTFVFTLLTARGTAMRSAGRAGPAARTRGLGPLRLPGFAALVCCASGLGAAFGIVGVAVPAYASHSGDGGLAGVLLAVWGTGSAVGGIVYGLRGGSGPRVRRLYVLTLLVAVSIALLAAAPSPLALAIVLILGGVTVAPALTAQNSLVGVVTPAGMLTEAYTWMVTISIAASAGAGALVGPLVDRPGGVRWAFLIAAGCVAAGALAVARSSLAAAASAALDRAAADRAAVLDRAAAPDRATAGALVSAAESSG